MNRVSELLARGVGEPVGRAAQHAVELLTHRQIAEARAVRLTSALRRLAGVLDDGANVKPDGICLLYTSPSPRDRTRSRMPSSA